MRKVTFSALMKKLEVKSLNSLDKGARLILEFNVPDDDLIAGLNRLMKADSEVMVAIVEQERSLKLPKVSIRVTRENPNG